MRKLKTGSAGGPEMRHFPRFIVPLLLFLIMLLVGSLVWLEDERRDRQSQVAFDATSSISRPYGYEAPWHLDDGDDPVGSGRQLQTSEAQRDTRRKARSAELDRMAPLDPRSATTGPGRAQTQSSASDVVTKTARSLASVGSGTEDPTPFDYRVVWIVPDRAPFNQPTPEEIADYFVGQAADHPGLAALGRFLPRATVVVGRLNYNSIYAGDRPPFVENDAPPAVVSCGDFHAVPNSGGWFAVQTSGVGDGRTIRPFLIVNHPGWEVASMTLAYNRVALIPGQKRVSIDMTPAVGIAVEVEIKTGASPSADAARTRDHLAWAEVCEPPSDRLKWHSGLDSPRTGVFIEAKVPAAGSVTFILPMFGYFSTSTDQWYAESVWVGATGCSWGGKTELKPAGPGSSPDLGKPPITYRPSLRLVPVTQTLIVGCCAVPTEGEREPPGSPVRVESPATGHVTWTDTEGTFAVWSRNERRLEHRHLVLELADGMRFDLPMGDEDAVPPYARLVKGGRAPSGPWEVNVPPRGGAPWIIGLDTPLRGAVPTGAAVRTPWGWVPFARLDGSEQRHEFKGLLPRELAYGDQKPLEFALRGLYGSGWDRYELRWAVRAGDGVLRRGMPELMLTPQSRGGD